MPSVNKLRKALKVMVLSAVLPLCAVTQQPESASHRTRLYLKDGSYQVVLSYRISGSNVIYRSAERGGEQEEIPTNLVDLDRTQKWEASHDPTVKAAPVIDPELAREEAERAAHVPEVAPNLHLPERESLLVLDNFRDTPQLIPLTQTDGDLNRQTSHNILRQSINPLAHAHQLVQIKGVRAAVQLHVPLPELYIRISEENFSGDAAPVGALEVDTQGSSSRVKDPKQNSAGSQYVIVRVDVRQDVRIVSTFSMNLLGAGKMEEDVVPTKATVLPGGHWMKLVPVQPLTAGEYALIEVLSDHELNLAVWDFGVHPAAPQNRDAILPVERRKPSLEDRSSH
ncbi:hypothetical protein [Terriglobus saanensis]|uniref:Uncharacterized protein n=1 Tax=Terriglobus saanensis (strain ATCC BAA-1853 / DSM 23119 / SP1PR4) TaxID=401053 RepID=E8V866_TERSS|nr:hypothetical protein [Terriglobus saanensis]ADV84048.1 hypothetical protein AciPR4_3293 [Terriglobus saanensis SP1PR4]